MYDTFDHTSKSILCGLINEVLFSKYICLQYSMMNLTQKLQKWHIYLFFAYKLFTCNLNYYVITVVSYYNNNYNKLINNNFQLMKL